MDPASRRTLTASERDALRAVKPKRLRKLDEDELVELHRRVRRARNKYAKLHRRRAASEVRRHKSRAVATKSQRRTAACAEAFEDALATVSDRLAKVARARAEELRAERLEAAGKIPSTSRRSRRRAARSTDTSGADREHRQRRTPVRKRRSASSRAANRRHHAKRAARRR
jgi:hypothetical protein